MQNKFKNKKIVAFLIPCLGPGGMERVMSELVNYFSKKNSIVLHLIIYGKRKDVFYDIPDRVKIHYPDFEFNDKHRLWCTIKTLLFLRKLISQICPDSILSFGEYWNSLVLLSLLFKNEKIYISDRCRPDKSLGMIHDVLRFVLYKKAKGVVVQTRQAYEIYSKFISGEKIKTIGNPIRNIVVEDIEEKEDIVLSVGRLIHTKHHDELIKLFVRIGRPDWKLVIVGDDALKQNNMIRLKELIKELGAEHTVELAGNRTDVDDYYRKSKIFAFTSSSEGFPNVIGEAMAAGLPVISFDCIAGPSDMITNKEDGYLVPLFDYDTYRTRLEDLMNNGVLREKMGQMAKINIKRYSVQNIGNEYHRLLLSEK
ncbi:MAG: glycosyltransferase family 4 protein [Planctomycetes bacterium]|nr:glycosyltransferase family 4 protein [Planctomycetota bacterium]